MKIQQNGFLDEVWVQSLFFTWTSELEIWKTTVE